MKHLTKKLTTIVILTALLLTPALPAGAGGGPAVPGLVGWVQGWVTTAMSWVTGEEGPKMDPHGLESDGCTEPSAEGGPCIDPWGLTDSQSTEEEGEGGGMIDPMG